MLFQSGQPADDGVPLGSIDVPVANAQPASPGVDDIAFTGVSTAVVKQAPGGSLIVVARTGSPLPAPLAGTYNRLASAVIGSSGKVAFTASLNAPSSVAGAFLDEGDGPHVAFLTDAQPTRLAVDGSGDLAYVSGSSVFAWERASGVTTGIPLDDPVIGLATPQQRGALALADDGLLGFVVRERSTRLLAGGLFVWRRDIGLRAAVRVGDTVPGLGTINSENMTVAAGGSGTLVARVRTDGGAGFVRYTAGDGSLTVVTGPGRPDPFPPDATALEALLAPGFGADEAIPSAGGANVWLASRAALCRLRGSHVEVVLRNGELLPDGRIATLNQLAPDYRFLDGRLFVSVQGLEDAGAVYLATSPHHFRKIVAVDGGSAPPGTTVISRLGLLDAGVTRGRFVFAGSVVTPDAGVSPAVFQQRLRDGRTRALVRSGDAAPGGGVFTTFGLVPGTVGAPLVLATLADGRRGLFALRGRHLAKIAVDGEQLADAVPADPILDVEPHGSQVLLLVGVTTDGLSRSALYVARSTGRRRVRLIARTGDAAPGNGTIADLRLAFGLGRGVLFDARIVDADRVRSVLVRAAGRRLERVVADGDPVEGGGTTSGAEGNPVTAGKSAVAFVGSLNRGDDQRLAIFETRGGVVRSVLATGDATPVGGPVAFLDSAVPLEGGRGFVASVTTGTPATARVLLLATGRRPRR